MKYLIFTLLCLSSSLHAQVDTIAPTFKLSFEAPRLYLQNQSIHIQSDTAWLINNQRYQFYNQLHQYILNGDEAQLQTQLILSYEKSLQNYDQLFTQLQTNCLNADLKFQELSYRMQDNIQQSKETLLLSRQLLNNSAQRLTEIETTVNDMKRKLAWESILTGAVSIGVGVLLGVGLF